jgi:hypothetical protein
VFRAATNAANGLWSDPRSGEWDERAVHPPAALATTKNSSRHVEWLRPGREILHYEQMARTIISIEYQIPGFSDVHYHYSSDQSLLDADVIVFQPIEFYEPHGKPSYDESASFTLKQATRHWKLELSTALEYGKTIFLIFRKFQNASFRTGNKEFKGARTIIYTEDYDNYRFLPLQLPPIVAKGGSGIVFKGNPVFATFWKEFRGHLKFESYLDIEIKDALFVTKTGERPIGAIFNVGKGKLVLLPPIDYDEDKFTKTGKGEEVHWTEEAIQFGSRLVEVFCGIDEALRANSGRTPPPAWVNDPEFVSAKEAEITVNIDTTAGQIESLIEKKGLLSSELEKETQLKDLLFETGRPLEAAVIMAFRVLGYSAEGYDDGELRLDQVIMSPDGERFIGECEGKDSVAINIDKYRQLEENIQTDLQKDDVQKPATGILFGNGFRLTPPEKRAEQFTQKCLASAKRGTILIRTMDLYPIVRYIQQSHDEKYAKRCRDAIAAGTGGIVQFPPITG